MIISLLCSQQERGKDWGERALVLHWRHDQQWACDCWAWRSDHGEWECRLFVWMTIDNDSNGDDNDGIVQGCLHQHRGLLSIVINCCPLLSIVVHWNERLLYLSMMKMFFWYYHCNHKINSPAAPPGCRGHADPQNRHLPRRSQSHPVLRHVAGCGVAGDHSQLIFFKLCFYF